MINNPAHLDLRHRMGLALSEKLRRDADKMHPLKQLFWECTLRCNLHCRHCGSDCKVSSAFKDMPFDDFAKVLDSVAAKTDPHKVFVIITGGEPLMRTDLEKCGLAIYKKGFPWGMVTNGFLLTEKRYDALLKSGLHTMTISLDGLEEQHDWMRGVKGSYARASEAIKMVASSGKIIFDVVTCVNSKNYDHLDEIKAFLVDAGVRSWRLFTVFPVGRAATDTEMQLTNEQFRGLMRFIVQCRKDAKAEKPGSIMAEYGCEGFLGNFEGDVRGHFYTCQAGVSVGSVLCDGSISACPSIRADYHQGNIYQDDFMDVWEKRFELYRDRSWMRKGDCADCKYWKYCKGNGMHLRDDNGNLILCHLKRLREE